MLSRFYLGRCLIEVGELREAAAIIEEALGVADTLDDPWGRVLSYIGMAEVDIHRGDATRTLSTSARALDLCAAHVPFLFAIAASTHGWALARSNRVAEAVIPTATAGCRRAREPDAFPNEKAMAALSDTPALLGDLGSGSHFRNVTSQQLAATDQNLKFSGRDPPFLLPIVAG